MIFMKLQEELNDKPFITLKYDGKRKNKKYSLLIAQNNADQNVYSRQSDNVEKIYYTAFDDNNIVIKKNDDLLLKFNQLVEVKVNEDDEVIIIFKGYIYNRELLNINVFISNYKGIKNYNFNNCSNFILNSL